jgi:hypothetical protein
LNATPSGLCPLTRRPLAAGQTIRHQAAEHFEPIIAALEWLPQELAAAALKQVRHGATQRVDGSKTEPLPYSAAAREAQWVYTSTWRVWTVELADTAPPPLAEVARIGALTANWGAVGRLWVASLPRLTTWRYAAQAVDELQAATTQALHAIDRPPDQDYAGLCPECGHPLYAHPGAGEARCRRCHTRTPVAESRRATLDRHADKLLTASQLQLALQSGGIIIKPATIRKWHERKLLQDHGRAGGRRLYLLGEVLAQADKTRAATR